MLPLFPHRSKYKHMIINGKLHSSLWRISCCLVDIFHRSPWTHLKWYAHQCDKWFANRLIYAHGFIATWKSIVICQHRTDVFQEQNCLQQSNSFMWSVWCFVDEIIFLCNWKQALTTYNYVQFSQGLTKPTNQ